jgi:hypothetical protein
MLLSYKITASPLLFGMGNSNCNRMVMVGITDACFNEVFVKFNRTNTSLKHASVIPTITILLQLLLPIPNKSGDAVRQFNRNA